MLMATKTPNQIVAHNVESLRLEQGLSQTDIGKAIGRSQSAADRRLKGLCKWSLEEITVVAQALGVTTGFLLQEHEN